MALLLVALFLTAILYAFSYWRRYQTTKRYEFKPGRCTARGTAAFWVDYFDLPFKGAGTYHVDGFIYEITKDGSVPKPKALAEQGLDETGKPAHKSLEKYGYGQMFFGKITHESLRPTEVPLEN